MDISHFYVEQGEGRPLILLHGNGENCDYFLHQIKAFSKRYHVYAIDTRGHGRTPRGNAPFTIRQFAEDLTDFMDLHKISKADLLGFSDGANIALIFALKYPDRVNKLILNGGNLTAKGVKPSVQVPIEIGYGIAKLLAGISPRAKSHAEMLGLMVNDPNIPPEVLSSVQAKTLVIAGTKDMIRKKHTELIAHHIPHAEIAFIEGDHFVAVKNPTAFNRVVGQFLND